MSSEAAGQAAQDEADAIIQSLGLDGDKPLDPNRIASQIESEFDDEFVESDEADQTEKAGKAQAGSSTATGAEGKTAAASDDGSKAGEQPAGVLLKDGKHFLPYEKHVEERRARVEAETRAKQLEEQLAAFKAGKGTEGEQAGAAATSEQRGGQEALDADLKMVAELEAKAKAYEEEGLSELAALTASQAKGMRSLVERMQKFGGYVEKLEAREREEQQSRTLSAQEEAAQAVENHPTLRYLDDTYDTNPKSAELFDRIKAEDAFLRTLPGWQKKPLADRFAAAVKRVELETGAIQVPVEYQTTAQVRAAAAERTREQGGEFRPNTLSDLPGGGVPRGADDDPFEGMDPSQLERLMDDPKKMAEILARAPVF